MHTHLSKFSSYIFWLQGLALGVTFVGCGPNQFEPASQPVNKVEVAPYIPAVIEIGEVKAIFEAPDVARIEIPYRFTSGHPVAHYQCDIRFVETNQGGIKSMSGWELKDEGVIKTGFNVSSPPGDKVEVVISEAESPDRGYKRISNTVMSLFEHAKKSSDNDATKSAADQPTNPK